MGHPRDTAVKKKKRGKSAYAGMERVPRYMKQKKAKRQTQCIAQSPFKKTQSCIKIFPLYNLLKRYRVALKIFLEGYQESLGKRVLFLYSLNFLTICTY